MVRVTQGYENPLTGHVLDMPRVNFGSEQDSVRAVLNYRAQMLPQVGVGMSLPQASTPIRDSYAFSAGMGHGTNMANMANMANMTNMGNMVFSSPFGQDPALALTSPFSSQFATGVPKYLIPN